MGISGAAIAIVYSVNQRKPEKDMTKHYDDPAPPSGKEEFNRQFNANA
ncbi:MAG TPA: hypothetical protein V6D02_12070 [Candidatus Obscuribacterales bacterium]